MASLPTDCQYLHRERRTFRVRGVPHDWNRDRLASFLAEHGYAGPSVQSLTTEIHRRSQTATVTFQDVPSQLQNRLADPAKGIHLYVPSSDQHNRPQSLSLETAFLGVTTLYSPLPQDHKVDVVAISGLGGHPFGSFKERHGEHMWLRDALPYDITEEGGNDRPVSRVMVYGYRSNLDRSDSFQNLEDLGTSFVPHLRKLAIAGTFKPIVFIAHSLGGLIVKQTLISLYKSTNEEDQKLLRAVHGIAFFGVPHHGMDISSLIPMVENGPNRFLLESIGLFSSQILNNQYREFLETLRALRESKIICFYETRMSPTAIKTERGEWKIEGPAAVLVSKSSATQCQEWDNESQFICAIDRTHSEMVKFGLEDDEYEKVVELIQSLIRDALKAQERRHMCFCQAPSQPDRKETTLKPCRSGTEISLEQIQNCLQSLAFRHMQTRASGISDAISGTCKWLFQHEAYIRWTQPHHGLLWIKGKPGSGKSTLVKYALIHQKDLSNTSSSTENSDLLLSFFFHGRGEELQRTPSGLLQSLLHQILKQAPDMLSDLVDDFTQKCKDMGNYEEKWTWHPGDLWRFLESSLPRILAIRSVWLFIDALDECCEVDAKDLVRKFKLLVEKMAPLSTYGKRLRICFSCRHYPILSSPGVLEVCLERENRGDISTFVRSELSSFGDSIPIKIPNLIIDRASGVFLWAELVVKHVIDLGLNGYGPTKIIKAVRSIPEGLDELYDGLIQNMTAASLKLIKWLCFARWRLSVDELRWAMALNADHCSLSACKNAEYYIPDNDCMKRQVVKLSRGLAEVTTGDDLIVQFIHQSVKDFFINKGLSKLFGEIVGDSISPYAAIGMSHLELAKTCIQYFATEEIVESTNYKPTKWYAEFPFLTYAISSWMAHLKESDDYGVSPEGILELFHWPSNHLVHLWSEIYMKMGTYSTCCPVNNTHLQHVAAKYGIQGVMNAILQSGSVTTTGIDSKDGSEMTPLAWAAKSGHEAIVDLLLSTKQVDVNVKFNNESMTPLSAAAMNGHEAVVKLLLATGQIDFDAENCGNAYSLFFASMNGYEAVVKLLLATGEVGINSKDLAGRTALSLAADHGCKAVVKLLLATGQAEINSKDRNGYTPLLIAAANGSEAIVHILLATGRVEINSKSNYLQTPLAWAAENGHDAVVRLLLATGRIEINSKDIAGWTPLSLAAQNGHKAVVKLLLATNTIEINSKDRNGYTPLSLAAANGHEDVVSLLLATGQVEIDAKDRNGCTPLSWAIKNGHGAVADLLQRYAASHY